MEEPSLLDESFQANEHSLFAEMNNNFPGEYYGVGVSSNVVGQCL